MVKNKKYDIKDEENTQNVSEPVSEYSVPSKLMSAPGCCTVDELNLILDKVEKNFSEGKGMAHDDAVKRIMAW